MYDAIWFTSGAWNGRLPGYHWEQGSPVGFLDLDFVGSVWEALKEEVRETVGFHLKPCGW
jgi:hypothetical protein